MVFLFLRSTITHVKKDEYIFGVYPVLEAIRNGQHIGKLYVQNGLQNPRIEQLVKQLEADAVSINHVPVEKLNRMVRSNHQGVIATVSPIAFTDIETLFEQALEKRSNPVFIILDQISDVRNFGAIVRTAECTGVDGIIIQKKGGAPVSGDTVKASAGAIFNVPICKVDHIKDAIFYAQSSGVTTIAATEKTKNTLYTLDLTGPIAIVMGSEGRGVSRSVLDLVDYQAALPLLGNINSLNVSVACAVFLYEIVRQRL
jgi:23S rRNA (guanosine2251-2'-O)-methyltransferase